jgi:Uma2 family endonuclease
MSAAAAPRLTRLNVERFLKMVEVGVLEREARVELIEGVMLDMAPIGPPHYDAVNRLARLLIERLPRHVAEVGIQGPLVLGSDTLVEPDLVVLRPRTGGYRRALPGPQDVLLVVEVADSSLQFDRTVKQRLYARSAVPHYAILNLVDAQLEVHERPQGDDYTVHQHCARPQLASFEAIPTLELPWSQVFD